MSSPLTIHDSSAPLLSQHFCPSSSPGTWSWVNLIDSSVKGAVAVLSRYSAAGVDPYTVIVGQLLCSQFRLSLKGSTRLKDAIMGLKSMNSLGAALHFGFGVDGVVRNLAVTQEGAVLVALCSAAVEAYASTFAADILWELVRSFDPPENRRPSQMQWLALIEACAGTLTTSEFPRIAEHFMQLHATANRLAVGESEGLSTQLDQRRVSGPESLAEALLAIGKVSTGEYIAITIVGGPDAGWLAAIAQWLFGLNIVIYDSDGQLLHEQSDGGQTQVHIIFEKRFKSSGDIQSIVRGKIFKLRRLDEVLRFGDNTNGSALVYSRVAWNNALEKTFRSDFKKLMSMSRPAGIALAAAGYIFDAVAKASPRFDLRVLEACRSYYSDIRGRRFITFAVSLFPELEPIQEYAEDCCITSPDQALEIFNSTSLHVKECCGCPICTMESITDRESFCLVLLLETIISIAHCMSGVSVGADLVPSRNGLEYFYLRQFEYNKSTFAEGRVSEYGQFGHLLERASLDCEDWHEEEAIAVPRIGLAARLFTGRGTQYMGYEQAAIGRAGVVVFLDILTPDAVQSDLELIGRCTVLPGHINIHGRRYERLQDFDGFGSGSANFSSNRYAGVRGSRNFSWLSNRYVHTTLTIRESHNSASIGLSFHESCEDAKGDQFVLLGPSKLVKSMCEATCLVNCDGGRCESETLRFKDVREDMWLMEDDSRCKKWLFRGDQFGRCVALCGAPPGQERTFVILQHQECISCCLEAAEASGLPSALIITKARPTVRRALTEQ